jgi:hypothetical protein
VLSLGCLVIGIGFSLFVHYDAFCLFVPCDRPATLIVEPDLGASTEGCSALLGDPDSPELTREARRIRLESNQADLTLGPWNERYRVTLLCPGRRPSAGVVVDFTGRETIRAHLSPGPPTPR